MKFLKSLKIHYKSHFPAADAAITEWPIAKDTIFADNPVVDDGSTDGTFDLLTAVGEY